MLCERNALFYPRQGSSRKLVICHRPQDILLRIRELAEKCYMLCQLEERSKVSPGPVGRSPELKLSTVFTANSSLILDFFFLSSMAIKCSSQVFWVKMIKSINYRISYIPQIKVSIQGGRQADSLLNLPDRVQGLECTSTHFCFICMIPGPCLYISPLIFYPNVEVEASGVCVCVSLACTSVAGCWRFPFAPYPPFCSTPVVMVLRPGHCWDNHKHLICLPKKSLHCFPCFLKRELTATTQ